MNHKEKDARIEELLVAEARYVQRVRELERMLCECVDELAGYLDQEYRERDRYPDLMRRWLRDTEIIVRARSLLDEQLPGDPEPRDMRSQDGPEIPCERSELTPHDDNKE